MPSRTKDFVELHLSGRTVKIPRGDMNDAEWEKVKADVQARGFGKPEDAKFAQQGMNAQPPPAAPMAPGMDMGAMAAQDQDMEFARQVDAEVARRQASGGEGSGLPGPMGAAVRMANETIKVATPPGQLDPETARVLEQQMAMTRGMQTPGVTLLKSPSFRDVKAGIDGGAPAAPVAPPQPSKAKADPRAVSAEKFPGSTPKPIVAQPMSAGVGEGESVKVKGKGVAGGAPSDQYEKLMAQAAKDEQAAIRAAAAAHATAGEEASGLMRKQLERDAGMQADIEAAQLAMNSELEKPIKAHQDLMAQLSDKSQTVDPNRLYGSMKTGNKVLAGISILLSGLGHGTMARVGAGGPNKALQILDQAIERDIDIQKTNIDNRRQGIQAQVAANQSYYGMLRQKGLTDVEAKHSARAAMWERAALEAKELALRTGRPEAMAQADALAAVAGQKSAENLARMQNARKALGLQAYELELKRREDERKAAGGGAGEQVRGPQAMELGALQSAEQVAQALKQRFGDKNIASRFADKLVAHVPRTDPAGYNTQRDYALSIIGRMVDGSVLQKHDLERWEKMMPSAGDLNGEEKLRILVEDIQTTYNSRRNALGQAGFAVQGFPAMGTRNTRVPGEEPAE